MAFDIYGKPVPDYFGTKQQGYDFDEQPQGYAGSPGVRSVRGISWAQPQGGLTYAQPSRAPAYGGYPAQTSPTAQAVRRSAPTTDYLGSTPTRQAPKDLTDEDRAAMQERYYQFQLENGDPLAQRRLDQIGQQKISATLAAQFAASPQGQAIRQNAGLNGPTASMANNPVPRDASFDTGDAYGTYQASQQAQRNAAQSLSRRSTASDPYGLNRAY